MATARDQTLISILQQFGLDLRPHLKSTLLEHLVNVAGMIEEWQEPEEYRLAGLCHSIYGTEFFQPLSVSLSERAKVRAVIGERAERLAYLFSAMSRQSLFQNLRDEFHARAAYRVFNRLSGEWVAISEDECRGLFTIALANDLEQRPRAAAEFKSIHRREYQRAQRFLSARAFAQFQKDYRIDVNGSRRVLVTGAWTEVGYQVAAELLAQGYDVASAVPKALMTTPQGSLPDGIERLELSREDFGAGLNAIRSARWHAIFDVLSVSGADVAQAAKLYAGAAEAYFLISSAQRADCELLALRLETALPCRSLVIRLPNCLGSAFFESSMFRALWRTLAGVSIPIAHDSVLTPIVRVDEVGRFIAWCLNASDADKPLSGIIDACPVSELTYGMWLEWISQASRRSAGDSESPYARAKTFLDDRHIEGGFEKTRSAFDGSRAARIGFRFRDAHEWLPHSIEEILKALNGRSLKASDLTLALD